MEALFELIVPGTGLVTWETHAAGPSHIRVIVRIVK